MYCKYCGKQIDDDSIYCPYCGKNLKEENYSKFNNDSRFISEKNNDRNKFIDENKKVTRNIILKIVLIISNLSSFFSLVLLMFIAAFSSSFFSTRDFDIKISTALLIVSFIVVSFNILINCFLFVYTKLRFKFFSKIPNIFRIVSIIFSISSIILLSISLSKFHTKDITVIACVSLGITCISLISSFILFSFNKSINLIAGFSNIK